MAQLHHPVLVLPELILKSCYLTLTHIYGVVNLEKDGLGLLLVLLLQLQIGD